MGCLTLGYIEKQCGVPLNLLSRVHVLQDGKIVKIQIICIFSSPGEVQL